MTRLRCPINQLAEHFPNEPALLSHDRTYTWGQYDALVSATSKQLTSIGIARGMRVALCDTASVELTVAIMALLRLGAVACLLSPRLPEQGIQQALTQCGADCLMEVSGKSPKVSFKIVKLPTIDEASERSGAPAYLDPDLPATIMFTSGSSAGPRAVLHSYANHYYNAIGSNENIPFMTGDRWLLSLPLYHVGGLAILFRSIVGGGAVVIPQRMNDLVEVTLRSHVTHLSLVSAQFIRFIEAIGVGIQHNLKAVLLGGSAMPGFLIRSGHALGLPLYTSYGMTEMSSQVATTGKGDTLERLLTSGRVLTEHQMEIAADHEILVRGKTRFIAYVDGPNTVKPFDADGWYHTGDLGEVDEDGYLRVHGRKDNMFISGGENIQPEEIERLLTQLDFVMDAVVVPVADAEFGFRPAAFVRTLDGRSIDERLAVMHLERHLPRFKIPDYFYTWPPGEAGMKVDRKRLAALVASD